MFTTKVKNFFRMYSTFKLGSMLDFYRMKYSKSDDKNSHNLGLTNGLKLSVNKSAGDLTTLFEIFVNEDYAFKGNRDAAINILDIGANVGYFSLYITKRFPNAKICSFEPFPDTFNRLTENINQNVASNIKPYKYAISDFNGTSDFYSFDWAGCNTLIDGKFDEGHYKVTKVDCLPFDDILKTTGVNEFEFGKIDCEGSEYRIFLNSKDEVIRSVKNYIIEVHDDKEFSKQDLVNRFKTLGYKVEDLDSLIKASL